MQQVSCLQARPHTNVQLCGTPHHGSRILAYVFVFIWQGTAATQPAATLNNSYRMTKCARISFYQPQFQDNMPLRDGWFRFHKTKNATNEIKTPCNQNLHPIILITDSLCAF